MFGGMLRVSSNVTISMGPFVDATDGFTQENALSITQADVRLSKNGGTFSQKNDSASASFMEAGWYAITLDSTDTNTLGRLSVAIHESGAGGARPVFREFMVVPANIWDSYHGTDKLEVDVQQWQSQVVATPSINGVPEVDLTHVVGGIVPTPTITGVPKVDQSHLLGSAVATPTTPGVQEVDVTHWNGGAVAAPTIVGVPKVDVVDWLGTTPATPTIAGVPEVDITHLGGVAQSLADLKDFADDGYDPVTNTVQATATMGGLSAQAKADVNAEVVDALNVDTYSEIAQGALSVPASLVYMVRAMYKSLRNKRDLDSSAGFERLYNDAGSVVDHKRAVTDAGGVASKEEWITGP